MCPVATIGDYSCGDTKYCRGPIESGIILKMPEIGHFCHRWSSIYLTLFRLWHATRSSMPSSSTGANWPGFITSPTAMSSWDTFRKLTLWTWQHSRYVASDRNSNKSSSVVIFQFDGFKSKGYYTVLVFDVCRLRHQAKNRSDSIWDFYCSWCNSQSLLDMKFPVFPLITSVAVRYLSLDKAWHLFPHYA